MITHNNRFLDTTAERTTATIINRLPRSLSQEERLALSEALYPVVRAALQAAVELYRLRLQHHSSN